MLWYTILTAARTNRDWQQRPFHLATRSLHQHTKITTYTKLYQEYGGSSYHQNAGNFGAWVDLLQDVIHSKSHTSSQHHINLNIQFQWLLNKSSYSLKTEYLYVTATYRAVLCKEILYVVIRQFRCQTTNKYLAMSCLCLFWIHLFVVNNMISSR